MSKSISKGIGGHHRPFKGITNEWVTPRYITKSLGEFDLDPCSMKEQPWKHANKCYTVEDDGLNADWGDCRVWLNPPYGNDAVHWLKKLSEHGNGIALIFARTDTKMFFEYCWKRANSMLFLEGRLYFYYPDGTKAKANAGGPSVLVAYGDENTKSLENSGLSGSLVTCFVYQTKEK